MSEKIKNRIGMPQSKLIEGVVMKNIMKLDLYQGLTSVLGNISLKVYHDSGLYRVFTGWVPVEYIR